MKAVIFALIVLLGVDLGMYHGSHLRHFGQNLAGFGESIGAWVFSPG